MARLQSRQREDRANRAHRRAPKAGPRPAALTRHRSGRPGIPKIRITAPMGQRFPQPPQPRGNGNPTTTPCHAAYRRTSRLEEAFGAASESSLRRRHRWDAVGMLRRQVLQQRLGQ